MLRGFFVAKQRIVRHCAARRMGFRLLNPENRLSFQIVFRQMISLFACITLHTKVQAGTDDNAAECKRQEKIVIQIGCNAEHEKNGADAFCDDRKDSLYSKFFRNIIPSLICQIGGAGSFFLLRQKNTRNRHTEAH